MSKHLNQLHFHLQPDVSLSPPSIPSTFLQISCNMLSNNSNSVEVKWDTGATLSVSPYKLEFVTPITRSSTNQIMKGITKGLVIHGVGEIE
jgi:hypothetical protein